MADYQGAIRQCSRMLAGNADAAGNGRGIHSPMLSVFFGEEAERFRETVENVYADCWLFSAQNLRSLDTEGYAPDSAEKQTYAMMESGSGFQDYGMVWTAYFWDIMDGRFADIFDKVCQPVEYPAAILSQNIYFIFCKETSATARKERKERLEELIRWARQEKRTLVVLSNHTAMGILGNESIAENYRLAANVMLLLNSVYDLAFALDKEPLFSAGYYYLGKNTGDIARMSLWQILDEYEKLPEVNSSHKDLKERLCPESRSYATLFEEIFRDMAQPLLPTRYDFLQYLPYTEDMRRFCGSLQGKHTGFALFRRNVPVRPDPALGEAAIASVSAVWEGCLEKYYLAPVRQALETSGNTVREYFKEKLASALNYEEMCELLPQGAEELEELRENAQRKREEQENGADLGEWLHCRACRELRAYLYGVLAGELCTAMKELHQAAVGFGKLLEDVKSNLRVDTVEPSVRVAYGHQMHNLAVSRRDLLMSRIRPCATADELLRQLCLTFETLTRDEKIYQYSLRDDLTFRFSVAGPGVAGNIIEECFDQDLRETVRLHTYESRPGKMYCMLSEQANFTDRIKPQIHGDVFNVPRRDCIERLLIYPVDPEKIIY